MSRTPALNTDNIMRKVFDGENEALRTSSVATVVVGDIDVSISADDGDSIAISDGVNTLGINSDGSINVNITSNINVPINVFNEITNLESNNESTIVSYTASVNCFVSQISVSGDNIATYRVLINGDTVDKARTYFGAAFNHCFDFKDGILLTAGQTVRVNVVHDRPDLGSFNARIQVKEVL